MNLFTSRFGRFQVGQGAPVRTTAGGVRFKLPYDLAGHARLITPTWSMVHLNDERVYGQLYLEMLTATGLDAIEAELSQIAADADGADRLVLLCFCDLSRAGAWCHRRMFADWWQQEAEEQVPELAEQAQPGLF